jgi:Lon protease-like protein
VAAEVLPLFPLGHVLLPAAPLRLTVFEPRYRRLLIDVRRPSGAPGAFGVVALRSGSEVGPTAVNPGTGAPDVEQVGTVAEIIEVEPRPDGSSNLLLVGSRRFAIRRLLSEGAPYLRGEVEFLTETDGPLTGELEATARALVGVYDSTLLRLTGRSTGTNLPEDAGRLSYHLAARLPLTPQERQELLADETTGERLTRLLRLLRRELTLLRSTRTIAVAPGVLQVRSPLN